MEIRLNDEQRLVVNAAPYDKMTPNIPKFQNVRIRRQCIEAVNGYVYCQKKIDYPADEEYLVDADAFASLKGEVVLHREGDSLIATGEFGKTELELQGEPFPNVEPLFSRMEGPVMTKVSFRKDLLEQLLSCFSDSEAFLQFYFYGEREPVRVTTPSGSTVAVIMPAFLPSKNQ